ncbi:unnamed protein product, partial [Protopolystoma xenopodis]
MLQNSLCYYLFIYPPVISAYLAINPPPIDYLDSAQPDSSNCCPPCPPTNRSPQAVPPTSGVAASNCNDGILFRGPGRLGDSDASYSPGQKAFGYALDTSLARRRQQVVRGGQTCLKKADSTCSVNLPAAGDLESNRRPVNQSGRSSGLRICRAGSSLQITRGTGATLAGGVGGGSGSGNRRPVDLNPSASSGGRARWQASKTSGPILLSSPRTRTLTEPESAFSTAVTSPEAQSLARPILTNASTASQPKRRSARRSCPVEVGHLRAARLLASEGLCDISERSVVTDTLGLAAREMGFICSMTTASSANELVGSSGGVDSLSTRKRCLKGDGYSGIYEMNGSHFTSLRKDSPILPAEEEAEEIEEKREEIFGEHEFAD